MNLRRTPPTPMGLRLSGLLTSLCSAVRVLLVKNFSNIGCSSRFKTMCTSCINLGRCASLPCICLEKNFLRQSVDSAAGPVALPFCRYAKLRRTVSAFDNLLNSFFIESSVWTC